MEFLPLIVIGLQIIIIFVLLAKIWIMRKSAKEIGAAFHNRLTNDTNTLIDISSRDSELVKLAEDMNGELRLLRSERHRFQLGDRELKEAVTNLSHDLRTPLTAITGYLDLLDREEKSEAIENYLLRIRNRTEAMSALTEELFRYSVVTSVQSFKPERMDLVRALEESLISFYGAMTAKGIKPIIRLPEVPVWRNLDKTAVHRILSNIISNSIKYTDGDLTVRMDENGTMVFANTADNLDPVTVGRLFDRFYTVEAARNSTGLGLSIAKELTERMGGHISAEYQDNKIIVQLVFLMPENQLVW